MTWLRCTYHSLIFLLIDKFDLLHGWLNIDWHTRHDALDPILEPGYRLLIDTLVAAEMQNTKALRSCQIVAEDLDSRFRETAASKVKMN